MAWLLLIPMLVSAALAQPGLHQSLWRDETATAIAITRSTGQLLDTLTNVDVSMTAYYLFMHAWSSVFGTSEIALRMPSLLAMIAAVGVVGLLGFRIASRSAGIVAASLMAVSPAAVRYSTEARPYALATLFVVVAAYVAHGPVRRAVSEQAQQASGVAAQTGSPRSVRRDLPWALIAALAVALHFLAIIAVLAQVFWLVGRRSRYAYALIPLATAFVLVVAVKGQASYQDWIQLPTAIGVLQSFVVLAGPAAVVLGFCGRVGCQTDRPGSGESGPMGPDCLGTSSSSCVDRRFVRLQAGIYHALRHHVDAGIGIACGCVRGGRFPSAATGQALAVVDRRHWCARVTRDCCHRDRLLAQEHTRGPQGCS